MAERLEPARLEFVLFTCKLDRHEFESRPPLGISVKIEYPGGKRKTVKGGGDLLGVGVEEAFRLRLQLWLQPAGFHKFT